MIFVVVVVVLLVSGGRRRHTTYYHVHIIISYSRESTTPCTRYKASASHRHCIRHRHRITSVVIVISYTRRSTSFIDCSGVMPPLDFKIGVLNARVAALRSNQ